MENQQLDHRSHVATNRKFPLAILAHDLDVPMNLGSLFRLSGMAGCTPAPSARLQAFLVKVCPKL
jgi:hypothetical protein